MGGCARLPLCRLRLRTLKTTPVTLSSRGSPFLGELGDLSGFGEGQGFEVAEELTVFLRDSSAGADIASGFFQAIEKL